MLPSALLVWLHRHRWTSAVGSIVLHLTVVGLGSAALLTAPEFSIVAGSDSAAGGGAEKMPAVELLVESTEAQTSVPEVPLPERVLVPVPVASESETKQDQARATRGGASNPNLGLGSGGVETVATPSPYRNPAPFYPKEAKQKNQEGLVLIWMAIDAHGRVSQARIHQSSGHRLLDESALQAARHYRFKPARRAGVAVASTTLQPFRFDLE